MKKICLKTILAILLILSFSMILFGQDAAVSKGAEFENLIKADAPVAIAYMASMLILKITAFILGYLIVKLGHDTLIKGVTGEFDFGFEGRGIKTKLKAAAPGTFFVLAGSAIIMWAIFVKKPYQFEIKPAEKPAVTQGYEKAENESIPLLPD